MCREWGVVQGEELWGLIGSGSEGSVFTMKELSMALGLQLLLQSSLPCHSFPKQGPRREKNKRKFLEQVICLLSSVKELGYHGFHGALKRKPRLQSHRHALCLLCLEKCCAFFSENIRSYWHPPPGLISQRLQL